MSMSSGLSEIHLPPGVSRRLENLEIRDVRQLYSRMKGEPEQLQRYLRLAREEFDEIRKSLEALIAIRFPEDALPHAHPRVNKRGVALDRLHDPNRPRYATRGRRAR